jgi:hypothetical protein
MVPTYAIPSNGFYLSLHLGGGVLSLNIYISRFKACMCVCERTLPKGYPQQEPQQRRVHRVAPELRRAVVVSSSSPNGQRDDDYAIQRERHASENRVDKLIIPSAEDDELLIPLYFLPSGMMPWWHLRLPRAERRPSDAPTTKRAKGLAAEQEKAGPIAMLRPKRSVDPSSVSLTTPGAPVRLPIPNSALALAYLARSPSASRHCLAVRPHQGAAANVLLPRSAGVGA